MRKAVVSILAVAVLAGTTVVMADTSDDEKAIKSMIKKMWKQVAEKNYDPAWANSDGSMQATSAGGFWEWLSADEAVAQINESPNKLEFTPHYINVDLLGANEDVAWVTFYLTGRITLANGNVIDNYRTRGSIVMEKVDGKWVDSGSHYSPLFAGSGVVLD